MGEDRPSQPMDEAVARWTAARARGRDAASEADLFGFFQAFRPDGTGLDDALRGAVGADEVLPRLLEVYRATAPGWDPADAYFLVRQPEPLSSAVAADLALAHVGAMREIGHALGRGDLEAALGTAPSIQYAQGAAPPPESAGLEMEVYELATDFVAGLSPVESDLLLLGEAAYGIACDYYVRHHVLWPLYRADSPVRDPFSPYFRLWRQGAALRFAGRERLVVYVPPPAGR